MPTPSRTGYSLLQIVLHWTIAALVLFQLLFGESMGAVIRATARGTEASASDRLLASLHYWFGLSILALVAVRLAVRLLYGAPAPAALSPLAARAATATHALFYALLVVVPVTGLLAYYIGEPWGDLHTLAKPVFIVLILLHAAAALFHQFWVRDGALRRISVPGAR